MGVALKIDRPFFLLIEGVLNGFLLLVLPMLPIPNYLIAFIGLCVNLLVAYLIAASPFANVESITLLGWSTVPVEHERSSFGRESTSSRFQSKAQERLSTGRPR